MARCTRVRGRLWNLGAADHDASVVLPVYSQGGNVAAFSPDGLWLIIAGTNLSALRLDVPIPSTQDIIILRRGKVTGTVLSFSPDSRWLVFAGNGAVVRL